MSKALDFVAKTLTKAADQNGDGKVDKADVAIAIAAARDKAAEETTRHPIPGLITAAVCGGLLMLGVLKGCGL